MTSELDKMVAVKEQSQAIGEFLEWLQDAKQFKICEFKSFTDSRPVYKKGRCFEEELNEDGTTKTEEYQTSPEWTPIRKDTEKLLAEFFGIDLNKAEQEKQDVLKQIREANKKVSL